MKTVHPLRARITAQAKTTRVDVYDDVGESGWSDGVTAKGFAGELSGVKGPLDVHVNSPGGNVWDGIAIASALRAHKAPVTVVVDGIAASIASVIVQAGADRVMMPGSMMMIHDASTVVGGNAADLAKAAQDLDDISANLANQYAARAGGTPEQWRDAMREETWYTAEEAVAAGLADRIVDGAAVLPAGIDIAAYAPGQIAARLKSMPTAPPPPRPAARLTDEDVARVAAQVAALMSPRASDDDEEDDGGGEGDKPIGNGWVMGADGKPRFDPDGDGDDDATPEGDTDHDYFDEDGKQIKPIPPMPKAKAGGKKKRKAGRENASVDSSAWDAAKAWHNGTQADDPEAFYAGICAGKRTGDPSTQEAWALPYKYHPSDPPNAAGVRNALARLSQTKGLINRDEARKTLEAAMRKINPDYEPDNQFDGGLLSAVLSSALEGGVR